MEEYLNSPIILHLGKKVRLKFNGKANFNGKAQFSVEVELMERDGRKIKSVFG
jgi:hypothetical protein